MLLYSQFWNLFVKLILTVIQLFIVYVICEYKI